MSRSTLEVRKGATGPAARASVGGSLLKTSSNLLFFILFFAYTGQLNAATITLVADDWCPYNCQPGSEQPGYVVEVAREVFEPAGYQVNYFYRPWSRAILGTLNGSYDGAIGTNPSEMPEGVFPELSQGAYNNVFVVRRQMTWDYTSPDSLAHITIGAAQNYSYGEVLDDYLARHRDSPRIDLLTGNNIAERSLAKLLSGRIDAYLEDKNVALYMARQMQITHQIRIAGSAGQPVLLYIGFSPQNPESPLYARLLSEGLQAMRESGRLQEILDKYGMADWQPPSQAQPQSQP